MSRDDLGNRSRSSVRQVRLAIRDSASAKWVRPAAGWQTSSSNGAIGRSLLTTRSRTSGLTSQIEGQAFALVAPIGPGRGSLRLRVDGGPWRTVDLRARKTRARRVVYAADLPSGRHTLEIRAGSGEAALDALLLLR